MALKNMKDVEGKKYEHNGKTIKIIPMKKVKKTEDKSDSQEGEDVKKVLKKTDVEKGQPKFAVNDRVSLKNIPIEYSGSGFAESIIIKVFKSTHDQLYRYSIRSTSGQELALVKEDQIKPRKINFKK
jgi:hypothetical protein